jgi:methionyl-tRNA synthetase
MISYNDFAKIEAKVGKILSAEKIPDTEKLLKLSVDFGVIPLIAPSLEPVTGEPVMETSPIEVKRDIRQIVSGIATCFPDPHTLVGRKCMFITNLEPRKIKGFESNGMLFALSTDDGKFSLLEPNDSIPEGTRAF